MSSHPCGADARSSMNSLAKEIRILYSFTRLVVTVVNTTGLSLQFQESIDSLRAFADQNGRVMNDSRARAKLRMTAFDLPAHGRSFPV